MSYILEVKDLVKSFGENIVLNGISFSVEKGEVVIIIGPSGTGKSTLLRCINALTPPDSGRVWLDGVDVMDPHNDLNLIRQDIGFVFQHFALFKHLTALQNVMLGLQYVKKLSKQEAREKAEKELQRVGLLDHMFKHPAELSGGQQQRVGIARSLAMDPKVMLFDEPTSALDPELTGEVLNVMRELAAEGMTMVVVSHEIGFARSVGNRMIFIDNGIIVEEGTPASVLKNARNERTREFLQKITELYGE